MVDFGDKSIDLTVSSRVQRLNGMLERASTRSPAKLTSAQRPSDRTVHSCSLQLERLADGHGPELRV